MTSSAVRTMTPEEEAAWVEDRLAGKPIAERILKPRRTLSDRILDVLKGDAWLTAKEVVTAMDAAPWDSAVLRVSSHMGQMWAIGLLERASSTERGLYFYRRAR